MIMTSIQGVRVYSQVMQWGCLTVWKKLRRNMRQFPKYMSHLRQIIDCIRTESSCINHLCRNCRRFIGNLRNVRDEYGTSYT